MSTITKFLLSFTGLALLNVLGKILFDIDPLTTEVVITLAFAITYSINEDAKNEIRTN